MLPEYSRAAQADINEIWLHLAEASLISADRVLTRIRATCERAGEMPLTGTHRSEFTSLPARFLVTRPFPYFVVYDSARDPIRVLRVLHTSRDIRKELASIEPSTADARSPA